MVQIDLIPDSNHCIETVAKREYRELVANYLHGGEVSSDLLQRIEMLRTFLESADFKKLRRESEPLLLQGQKLKYILSGEEGKINYNLVRL